MSSNPTISGPRPVAFKSNSHGCRFPRTVTLIKDTTNILDDEPGDEVTKAGGILEKMGWMEISNQR